MKPRIALFLLLLLICMLCLSSCGGANSGALERVLQDARLLYKEASVIALGRCLSTHMGAAGLTCSDMKITELISGEVAQDNAIHCLGAELSVGDDYLVYLEPYKADMPVDMEHTYRPLRNSPYKIVGEKVRWDGADVELNELLQLINGFKETVTIPSNVYYYPVIELLTENADEIFIGKVMEAPRLASLAINSKAGGASMESVANASSVSIMAMGSVKGRLSYGSVVTMVYMPDTVTSMINAASLEAAPQSVSTVVAPVAGNTYMFFLINSPDPKQEYRFALNPVQGWIMIEEDAVSVNSFNEPLKGNEKLESLITAIKGALD